MGEFAVGQPVPRSEDPRLLRGGGRYTDDVSLPGMVYGYVLRAAHAHAKVLAIRTDAAKAAPGVLAVVTDEDWRKLGWKDLPVGEGNFKRPDGKPMFRPVYSAMARGAVRWVGDPVAFVVAETQAQAMDAAELIEVDYEPLPCIVSTGEARQPGAPVVWPEAPDNICYHVKLGDKENAEKTIASAPHVIRKRIVLNRVTAATMEPRSTVASWDRSQNHFTVYTTLQRPFVYRNQVAEMIGVPESKVRIVAGDIGGSFGMKSAVFNEVACCILGSRMTGRPVKWTSTRSEAFLSDAQGRDHIYDCELALDGEGKFLAFKGTSTVNVGAYLQNGGDGAAVGNIGTIAGVYTTPYIHMDITTVFTNTNPMRPYRGNGRGEAAYAIERMVDLAADELGIDPVELRRRNMIPPSAIPYKTALVFTYDSGEFEACMDEALEMADYKGFEARRKEALARGKLRGIGVSFSIERSAAPGIEGAEIRFDRSGTVTLLTGATSQGQGHETTFKQLVADRLGLNMDDIHYVTGDTDAVFYGEGTGGSRSAALAGSAFDMATKKIVDKAKKIASHLLKVDDIEFEDGVFRSRKTNQSMTMGEVARAASSPNKLPPDMEPGLIASAVYNNKAENFPNGCHVCELEIDEETGEIDVIRYSVVDDVGTVLNSLLLKGQIKGGVAQGLGQMLLEDIRFDPESGQLLTGSFMDYAMPRAKHLSKMDIKSHPTMTKTNPLGVKGAGEAGCVGAIAAVGNAVVDALSPLGIRHVEMPATQERLWRVITDAKKKRA